MTDASYPLRPTRVLRGLGPDANSVVLISFDLRRGQVDFIPYCVHWGLDQIANFQASHTLSFLNALAGFDNPSLVSDEFQNVRMDRPDTNQEPDSVVLVFSSGMRIRVSRSVLASTLLEMCQEYDHLTAIGSRTGITE